MLPEQQCVDNDSIEAYNTRRQQKRYRRCRLIIRLQIDKMNTVSITYLSAYKCAANVTLLHNLQF